jgi:hypothetical protein
MPPRAKRDEVWRQKVWIEIIERGAPIEAQRAAADLVARATAEAIALVGRNHTAVLLDLASETAAEPGHRGRPSGSSAHKKSDDRRLAAIKRRDGGSPSGKEGAMAKELDSEQLHGEEREKVARRLRRKIKKAEEAAKK